jgi:hypothetical protein
MLADTLIRRGHKPFEYDLLDAIGVDRIRQFVYDRDPDPRGETRKRDGHKTPYTPYRDEPRAVPRIVAYPRGDATAMLPLRQAVIGGVLDR